MTRLTMHLHCWTTQLIMSRTQLVRERLGECPNRSSLDAHLKYCKCVVFGVSGIALQTYFEKIIVLC